MGYSQAVDKAWDDIARLTGEKKYSIKFISDTYEIDVAARRVLSYSCNVCAKDYVTIILLHYLAKKVALGALPKPTGEWIDFTDLEGGAGYYPAFKKRTIDQIVRKYGDRPEHLIEAAKKMASRAAGVGDVGVIISPLEEVDILIKMSRADEEFPADAGILFDRNTPSILCTEDIVVMTEIIVHQL